MLMTRQAHRSFPNAAAAAVFAAALAVPPATAQVTIPSNALEFEDAEIFRPTTDVSELVTVYDSDAVPRGRFTLGAYGDYARNPLEIIFVRSGETFSRLVRDLGTIQLSGAAGLLPNFSVGARLPGYVLGVREVAAGNASLGGTEAELGDIVINAKYTLLPIGAHGIGIAVLPEITLPSGNRDKFAGTGKLGWGGLAVVDVAPMDRLRISANFGGAVRDQVGGGPFEDPDDAFNDQLRYGIGAAYRIHERLVAISEVYGAADTSSPFDVERKTPVDIIGALRLPLGPVWLTFGGGAGLTKGQGSPDFRLFAGVTVAKPLEPAAAQVSARPADLSQSRKSYAAVDRDGDGRLSPGDLLEYQVHLVNTGAAPATNVVMQDPIPEHTRYVPGSLVVGVRRATDATDGDDGEIVVGPPQTVVARVARIDFAAGQNEVVVVFQVEVDTEITEITKVVNQAYASADGIPQFPLPPAETTIFPAVSEHEHVIIGPDRIELTEEIHFEFDRDVIRRESWPILKELASVLRQYPTLRIRIEGHTDSVGTDSYNQRLSERRALAVYDFLVGLDIDKDRMNWAGYGESRPIATNDTPEGRAMNRRTEFPIVNPEGLRNKVIEREKNRGDLAPQSEPEWLKRGEPPPR
jgi:uncharacterized repeat protein (TIGR01451 family)